MNKTNFLRVTILNFISSLIIAIVVVNILDAFGLNGGVYLGNLFGLYFLVVYGIQNLVQAREIPNNYMRFIFAIIFIIIFDILFLLIIPLLFGADIFPATEHLAINYNGTQFDVSLSKELYLAVFGIVMLIFNFMIYRRAKNVEYVE